MECMAAFKALANSEKAIVGALVIVAASAFVVIDRTPPDWWLDLVKWVFAFYVGGKTIQGAATAMSRRKPAQGVEQTVNVEAAGSGS
jgi:hypothetical protein